MSATVEMAELKLLRAGILPLSNRSLRKYNQVHQAKLAKQQSSEILKRGSLSIRLKFVEPLPQSRFPRKLVLLV